MSRVSVIIAAYNVEEYIKRAVESIQNQTYQDFEIIVCDDFSTDNTVEIVKDLMKKDNRIKLLENSANKKAAATRNRCIESSMGEFIAIQDADDFSHSKRLENQVKLLDTKLQYDFVSSRMFKFTESDDYSELMKQDPESQDYNYRIPYIESPQNKDFLVRNPYTHAPTMFRKTAIVAVGGYRVARETVRGQDSDLFMRLHVNGSRGTNLNKSLYFYFEGEDAFKRKKYKYRIHSASVRYKRFKEMGLMPIGYLYVLKPLIAGILPKKLLEKLR